MRYGSVCSGIEAATVAWHPLGWSPLWFSEIEPFPCRLLKYHYPNISNLGDMLKIEENEIFQKSVIDLLVGGTPCQSFSTAGLRGGLGDSRGNLALEFCRILVAKRPRWFLWENVPGVLSSRTGGGLDFITLLEAFRDCGYSCAWRVLDAQFFGVPQRRRRVFVVGYLGDDWRPPAAVLFESEGLRGNSTQGLISGKEVAGTIGKRTGGRSIGADEAAGRMLIAGTIDANYGRLQGASGQDACHGHSALVFGGKNFIGPVDKVIPLLKHGQKYDIESESFVVPINTQVGLREHKDGDGTGLGVGNIGDPSYTIQKAHHHAVCYPYNQITSKENRSNPMPGDPANTLSKSDPSPLLIGFQDSQSGTRLVDTHATLDANNGPRRRNGIISGSVVRRLTPMECERLQGFPDGYTAIPGAADSPRYEAIGNSMAVPVMHWIGRRIDSIDRKIKSLN